MPPAPATHPRPHWLAWLLLLLGASGFAALWVLASLYTSRQLSWMAVVGALDVAWLLRLGHWRGGAARMALGVAVTTAVVVLANWGITAGELGNDLGLPTWDSAIRLGANHAWTLAQLANGTTDLAWLAAALLAAAWASR